MQDVKMWNDTEFENFVQNCAILVGGDRRQR